MPVVRSYGLPEQEAKPYRADFNVPAASDIGSFGGNQARDLQQAGANLGRTADTTFGIFERVAKEANELKVDSDMNKFVVDKQKTLVDFAQLKGEDAIKGASAATESLLNSKKAMMEGAANDYQRNVLSRRLDAHMLDASGSITQHVAKEAQAARVQTNISTLNNLNNQAVIDQDNAKAFETGLGIVGDVAANTARIAHGQSASPEIIKDIVDTAQSKYVTGVLESKIAGNRPDAPAFYDKYKDKILAKDRPPLEKAIETLKTNQEIHGFVQTPPSGAGGDAKASTDYITRVTGGYEGGTEKGGMVPNKLGSGAYGPGQFMPGTWDDVRKTHPELNLPADMTTASRAQHISALNAFTVDNATALQAANLPATPANLYLAHRFGAKGAESVLKANPTAPLASILPADWFAKNPDMNGQTAGSFIQLAQARMQGVTQIPGVTAVPAPSNIADPLAAQVNAATSGRRAPTLESAVDAATAPPAASQQIVDAAQGVPDVRQKLIDLGTWRQGKLADAQKEYGSDPAKLAKAQAGINTAFEQQKQVIELQKNQVWDAIWTSIKNNPKQMPNPNLMSQIDPREQESIQKMVDRNIEGAKTKTNWGVYSELRTALLDPNPDVSGPVSKLNPMQFRPVMADDEFKEITKLQEQVRKGDPDKQVSRIGSIKSQVDDGMRSIGINPNPKPGSNQEGENSDINRGRRFEQAVQEQINVLEKNKPGHKVTDEELQQFIMNAKSGVAGTRQTSWWPGSQPKPAFEVTIRDVAPEVQAQAVKDLREAGIPVTDANIIRQATVVKIGDISNPDKAKIVSALKAEGKPTTDDEIVKRFKMVRLAPR